MSWSCVCLLFLHGGIQIVSQQKVYALAYQLLRKSFGKLSSTGCLWLFTGIHMQYSRLCNHRYLTLSHLWSVLGSVFWSNYLLTFRCIISFSRTSHNTQKHNYTTATWIGQQQLWCTDVRIQIQRLPWQQEVKWETTKERLEPLETFVRNARCKSQNSLKHTSWGRQDRWSR